MTRQAQQHPWAQVLTLGDQRFGVLVGGPFDGRCYPLDGTPRALDVPGPDAGARTVRYVLRDGYYNYLEPTTRSTAA